MTTTPPLVSAVMIFLNGESFIGEAIESVLAQTYEHWELLLVDDGSSDGSSSIAMAYADEHPDRIRYLQHDHHQNRGMSASRNLGIRHARGGYLAFLDADDVWLPPKFSEQVAFMEAHADVGMLYARTEYWHSWTGRDEDRDRDHVPDLGVAHQTFEPPLLFTLVYPLGVGTAPCLCSLLVRATAMARVGGFEESFRGFYEDQAFLSKIYLAERVAVSDDCWDRYRIHDSSCSAVVKRTGEYDVHRSRFLHWLRTYLQNQRCTLPEVWNALNDALPESHNNSGTPAEPRWLRLLRVAEGNLARLDSPTDNPDLVRIAIAQSETRVSYDIQLNIPRLPVTEHHRYVLSFLARADQSRSMPVGCAQGHAPWVNLGLYSTVDLTTEWQPYELPFVASADEDNARIHFDVGEQEISVEISAVALRSLSDARFVKPGLPATRNGVPANIPVEPIVEVGKVNFGSFRRVTPISEDFGTERGRPIDRYYIENFMAARADDIQGHVLEIGDSTYTRRYGRDRVTKSDVLHVTEGEPQATIIADLASADHIPSDSFDCVILTQTLQLIYDFRAAIRTIARILKPGGVLLATFPGISQSYDSEWGECWYWNFTGVSARRIFEEVFAAPGVTVETFGNVLAATAFLQGLAVEELTPEELEYRDPGYDVTIAVRAQKPGGSGERTTVPTRAAIASNPSNTGGAVVLMYHRIASGETDPWALCVSPEHFQEHLDILRRDADPMPLQQLLPAVASGHLPKRPVAVTFDDGYVDNLLAAKPLLERFEIPATVFITSGYMGGAREFWWDELERLLLSPGSLPDVLSASIGGHAHHWHLGESATYPEAVAERFHHWRAPADPPTPRHAAYTAIWQLLQELPATEQRRALDELWSSSSTTLPVRPKRRPLTLDELAALAQGQLVEIGAHTVTHPILAKLSPADQDAELRQSKATLEEALETAITSFAYPYGAHDDDVVPRVRDAGFTRACTTVTGVVTRRTDALRVPRVEVQDCDGNEFARRLRAWLT